MPDEFGSGQTPLGLTSTPRGQLQYPLDAQSEGTLKLALENVLKDVIIRRNRIEYTIPSGATSFDVASSYMVLTGATTVTIATIKGGREGMILTLQFTDANVTITDTGTGVADTVNLNAAFTSAANYVLQLLCDGVSWREVSRGVGNFLADVQVFTIAGTNTWTKPVGAKFVEVLLIGGGGGGGSGRRGLVNSARSGGGGGQGGNWLSTKLPASILASTETVTVGTGGTGGAAQSVDSTNGNSGNNGGNTSFGSWAVVGGGNSGSGGGTGSGAGGFNSNGLLTGGPGGDGDDAATGEQGDEDITGITPTFVITHGGGGGGGVSAGNAEFAGGVGGGGNANVFNMRSVAGGTSGAVNGGAGGNGTAVAANEPAGGGGGGGGGGNDDGVGGAGGNGALYGAGGGGGGACINGFASGVGGNGSDGIAIITTLF